MALRNGRDFYSDRFNTALVMPSKDAEITIFPPFRSPRVLDKPIIFLRLFIRAISHQQDSVICQLKRTRKQHHS